VDHPWTGEREGSTRSCLQPFASFGGVKLLPPCFSSKGFGPWLSHLEITSKTPANNFITSSSYEATGQEPFKRRIERSEFQIDAPLTNFGGIFEDPVTVLSAISQRSQNEKGWLLHLGRFHTTIILRQSIYTGGSGCVSGQTHDPLPRAVRIYMSGQEPRVAALDLNSSASRSPAGGFPAA
jgi:hypothetical protein